MVFNHSELMFLKNQNPSRNAIVYHTGLVQKCFGSFNMDFRVVSQHFEVISTIGGAFITTEFGGTTFIPIKLLWMLKTFLN